MPPPRKIDLLPQNIRSRLQQLLKERGFSDYVAVTDELNGWLDDAGLEVSVGKSAVHSFGREYEQFAKVQEEASAWAESWMEGNGLEDEAKQHSVLFQMMTTCAFKVLKSAQMKDGDDIDPQNLAFLGKMMKDIMTSSGMRERLKAEEARRIAEEARQVAQEEMRNRIDTAEAAGDVNKEAAQNARMIMGFA